MSEKSKPSPVPACWPARSPGLVDLIGSSERARMPERAEIPSPEPNVVPVPAPPRPVPPPPSIPPDIVEPPPLPGEQSPVGDPIEPRPMAAGQLH